MGRCYNVSLKMKSHFARDKTARMQSVNLFLRLEVEIQISQGSQQARSFFAHPSGQIRGIPEEIACRSEDAGLMIGEEELEAEKRGRSSGSTGEKDFQVRDQERQARFRELADIDSIRCQFWVTPSVP
jgi:hypothetical protein